eukprot:scaffold253279_cov24-Prasinocladus_malaysianus.AAC.1
MYYKSESECDRTFTKELKMTELFNTDGKHRALNNGRQITSLIDQSTKTTNSIQTRPKQCEVDCTALRLLIERASENIQTYLRSRVALDCIALHCTALYCSPK